MKKILPIIIKDTLIRFTSPVEWLFFLILPVVFILILSGGTGPSSDPRLQLEVVDQAQSVLSRTLIAELENSTSVKPVIATLEDAVSDFESNQVSAILIIPEDFIISETNGSGIDVTFREQKNNLNALIHKQAVQVAVQRVANLLDVANASVVQAEAISPFDTENERLVYFESAFTSAKDLMAEAPTLVSSEEGQTEDTINYDPRANSTVGQTITWVFIPLIGLSTMLASERERGTLSRLLVTPTSKATFIGSTVIGQVLTAILQMTILISFGTLVLNVNWGSAPFAVALVILSSALAAASLGVMLGTFVKTEGQANGLSIMIGMVMAMMGGCWYPIELFPQSIRSAVRILPTTWAMQGFLDIAVRGQNISGVLLESGVLLGFALLFFTIGVWRFRYE